MQERVIDRVEVYKLGGDSFLYFDGGERNVLFERIIYNEIKVIYVKRYTYISRDIHRNYIK